MSKAHLIHQLTLSYGNHSDQRRVTALKPLNSPHFNFRRAENSPKIFVALLKFAIISIKNDDFPAYYIFIISSEKLRELFIAVLEFADLNHCWGI